MRKIKCPISISEHSQHILFEFHRETKESKTAKTICDMYAKVSFKKSNNFDLSDFLGLTSSNVNALFYDDSVNHLGNSLIP